mgnify:FL=1
MTGFSFLSIPTKDLAPFFVVPVFPIYEDDLTVPKTTSLFTRHGRLRRSKIFDYFFSLSTSFSRSSHVETLVSSPTGSLITVLNMFIAYNYAFISTSTLIFSD